MEKKKEARLQVRLTEEQDKKLLEMATRAGMDKSGYVLDCCFKKKKQIPDKKKEQKMLGVIVEMQNTLNQMRMEQNVSDITLNQMGQEVEQLWQLLR